MRVAIFFFFALVSFVAATDNAVLLALYVGFGSSASIGWNTNLPICGQTGVTCDVNNRVTQLSLPDLGLGAAATIVTEIGLLTSLNYL